jgi:hypothetical protein
MGRRRGRTLQDRLTESVRLSRPPLLGRDVSQVIEFVELGEQAWRGYESQLGGQKYRRAMACTLVGAVPQQLI